MTIAGTVQKQAQAAPNILLIIGDDMGVETLSSYGIGENPATTATLDQLASDGVRFNNFWSQAICSPTRATIMTGRYGFRTGIGWPVSGIGEEPAIPARPAWAPFEGPGMGGGMAGTNTHADPTPGLSAEEFTLPMALKANPELGYTTAAIGKWHLADVDNGWQDHPNRVGFDHFSGLIPGITRSYFAWQKVVNGEFEPGVGYTPEDKADDAIAWIAEQEDEPWFVWFAFNLPHTPLHLPPDENWQADHSALDRHGIAAEDSAAYFKAMIEAMDAQIGRVLASIEPEVRENTYVIFLGDNGTIGRWISPPFDSARAKSTIFQGGVNVPLIVTGPGVERGVESEALVNSSDLFFTIMEMAGIDPAETVPDEITTDSVSFFSTLSDADTPSPRDWTYADVFLGGHQGVADANYAIRDARYKLLRHESVEQFYDLIDDPYENRDLLAGSLSSQERAAYQDLSARVHQLRNSE
jgi:arylsulfatase A-like enzyme